VFESRGIQICEEAVKALKSVSNLSILPVCLISVLLSLYSCFCVNTFLSTPVDLTLSYCSFC